MGVIKAILKFVLWIFVVVLFTALVVGGTIGVFYFSTDEFNLPERTVTFGDQEIGDPIGYQWDVPVFWGVTSRSFGQSDSLSVSKLNKITQPKPQLVLPAWATDYQIGIKDGSGKTILNGVAADYDKFSFPQNDTYTVTLTVNHNAPAEKPRKAQGYYRYCFKFTLSAGPQVTLSANEVSQGTVVGIKVTGLLGQTVPTAQCLLGNIWFSREGDAWYGYLPVAYNSDAGEYSLTVSAGGQSMEETVKVYNRDFARVVLEHNEDEPVKVTPEGAGSEYRAKIWPLYEEGSLEKQWYSTFTQPVKGTVVQDYGVFLVTEGGTTRSCDLTIHAAQGSDVRMPANGRVAFAGPLLLCGNTVVVDHGCGVKTYISGLGELYVQEGDQPLQGETIASVGEEDVIIEMRIGNKSVYPYDAWRGNGGLFIR